jgi:hypothetical protein
VINPEGKPQLPQSRKSLKLFMHAFMPDWEERERELRGYTVVKSD